MIVAHLSDLHLRNRDDVVEFAHQLDRVALHQPLHLAITGDLLDRWDPALLEHTLDILGERGWLDGDRASIIHGNHDLSSSGGHPRDRRDLWRLVARFWDPPPLITWRRREFHRRIERRAASVALRPGEVKTLPGGLRLVMVDSIPALWMPVSLAAGTVTLRSGEGRIPASQVDWLSAQAGSSPLAVLIHHYPLPVGSFRWNVGRLGISARLLTLLERWQVVVTMEMVSADRDAFWKAAHHAGVSAVLCGHVHRARLDRHGPAVVGLNGQSGAAWAGRTIAYYRVERDGVSVEYEPAARTAAPARTA